VRRTSRLVLLLGIFLAALTFVVVLFLSNGNGGGGGGGNAQASAPPTQLATVVAAVDIPLGTVVTQDMLGSRTLAVTVRDANAFGDASQAVGKTTRLAITAGAQIHSTDFQNRAVPLSVPQGMRAFAIQVNELTGVGNLIDVGDRIDLVISLRGDAFPVVQVLSDGSVSVIAGINPLSVKLPLLLQDVQIIGTIEAAAPAPAQGANGQPAPSTAPALTGLTKELILAVTPQQAEALLFARTAGTLDVLLRSTDPKDANVKVETTGVILKKLVDAYGVLPPELVQVPIPTPKK
jgi:Flp pilus assembly protein CpaB